MAQVGSLLAQLAAKDVELTGIRVAASHITKVLDAMTRNHGVISLELDSLHEAGHYREGVSPDLVERVCTGYSWLMRTHATSYKIRLHRECAVEGGVCRVISRSYRRGRSSLLIYDATSDEERGDRPSPKREGDDDIIEVVFPPSIPP